MKGTCPKCKKHKWLTQHHVFPLRHYPNQTRPLLQPLCRKCHDELERIIPFEKMTDDWYPAIVQLFLSEDWQ